MPCRLFFCANKFDGEGFGDHCSVRVAVDKAVPEPPAVAKGDEFDPVYSTDSVYEYLEWRHKVGPAELNEANTAFETLNLQFDVLAEPRDGGAVQFRGMFSSETDESHANLRGIDTQLWLNWVWRMFVVGSLDDGYLSEITGTADKLALTIRRKVNGIYIAVFECPLHEVDLDESVDIMGDLYGEYSRQVEYKGLIRKLMVDNRQLEADYKTLQQSTEKYAKTNENIREKVNEVFLPLINSQKATILQLQKQLGQKQDLNFSSIKSSDLISHQQPNREIDFPFDESRIEEYRREIQEVSPRKRRKVNQEEERPENPKEEEEEATDKDSDEEPTLQRHRRVDGEGKNTGSGDTDSDPTDTE